MRILQIKKLKIKNEYANLISPLSDEDYKNLESSIVKDGLIYPLIVNIEDIILDGHHRYKICKEHGITEIETIRKYFTDELDEREFVITCNLNRRHLTTAQRAELGVKLLEIEDQKAKRRQLAGLKQYDTVRDNCPERNEDEGKARDLAGEKVGVSGKTVKRAQRIMDELPFDEQIAERWRDAKAGKDSINAIYTDLKRRESIDKEIKATKPTFNRTNENIEIHSTRFTQPPGTASDQAISYPKHKQHNFQEGRQKGLQS